jgi:diaminopimelate epimerase
MPLPFLKMHGLGNDFVVLDGRQKTVRLSPMQYRWIADRRYGIGCDQLITLQPSQRAAASMRIFNPDGGEVGACGNATRCVADLLMRETKQDEVMLEVGNRLIKAYRGSLPHVVQLDMGVPVLEWQGIPVSKPIAPGEPFTLFSAFPPATMVNMGNPHAVIFVKDVAGVNIEEWGPKMENHPFFPEKANITWAKVVSPEHVVIRVWERAAGATLACGTAACATVVAARLQGLVEPQITVTLPGGDLQLAWQGSSGDTEHPVWMEGPAETSFSGVIDENKLLAVA